MIPNLVSDEDLNARKRIPTAEYHTVLTWSVIPTVDFVPTRMIDGVRHFLLGRRKEQPFQNKWFVTGGRINRGEAYMNALARQIKRELGIDLYIPNPDDSDGEPILNPGIEATFVGILDVLNPAGEGTGDDARPEWHSIWHFFDVEITDLNIEVKALAENEDVKWFQYVLPEFPDPVREGLYLLGFEDAPE